MISDGLLLTALAVLALCGGAVLLWRRYQLTSFHDGLSSATSNGADASACIVGPYVRGKNSSAGMPKHPTATPTGWKLDMPVPSNPQTTDANAADKHVHSVTFNCGSLTGKTAVRVRGRWDIPAGVELKPWTGPGAPTVMIVWIQRKGDDWSAANEFQHYRWYAGLAVMSPIVAGEFDLTIPLAGAGWTDTMGATQSEYPAEFKAALDNCASVGIGFGGGTGYMHGLFATGPGAALNIEQFEIV